jgi:putative ABC transport system permease protein
MAIPLKYNIRHAARRWRTSLFTVFIIGLVVALFVSMLALTNGLNQAFATTGDPLNVLVLRQGSTAETNSTINRTDFYTAKFLDGIAVGSDGTPLVTVETINIASLARPDGARSNASIRGVSAVSMRMRDGIKLVEGRMPTPGLNELVVGNGAASRFGGANVGDAIRLVKSNWTIVGRFDGGSTAFNSEFWGDVEQLNREFDRTVYSSMLMRAATPADVDRLIATIEGSQRLANLEGRRETDYYKEQTKSSAPIKFLGLMISFIMAVGAVFAAMNAMYATVASRSSEIATLRVLGFSRRSILLAFMIEAAVTGVAGGIVGGLMSLPMNGVTTGTTSFTTFSEISFAFQVTPGLLLGGVIFATVIGVIGGFLPALQASRLTIIDGLRGAS